MTGLKTQFEFGLKNKLYCDRCGKDWITLERDNNYHSLSLPMSNSNSVRQMLDKFLEKEYINEGGVNNLCCRTCSTEGKYDSYQTGWKVSSH